LALCKSGPPSCKPDDKRVRDRIPGYCDLRKNNPNGQHTAAARVRNRLGVLMNHKSDRGCPHGNEDTAVAVLRKQPAQDKPPSGFRHDISLVAGLSAKGKLRSDWSPTSI